MKYTAEEFLLFLEVYCSSIPSVTNPTKLGLVESFLVMFRQAALSHDLVSSEETNLDDRELFKSIFNRKAEFFYELQSPLSFVIAQCRYSLHSENVDHDINTEFSSYRIFKKHNLFVELNLLVNGLRAAGYILTDYTYLSVTNSHLKDAYSFRLSERFMLQRYIHLTNELSSKNPILADLIELYLDGKLSVNPYDIFSSAWLNSSVKPFKLKIGVGNTMLGDDSANMIYEVIRDKISYYSGTAVREARKRKKLPKYFNLIKFDGDKLSATIAMGDNYDRIVSDYGDFIDNRADIIKTGLDPYCALLPMNRKFLRRLRRSYIESGMLNDMMIPSFELRRILSGVVMDILRNGRHTSKYIADNNIVEDDVLGLIRRVNTYSSVNVENWLSARQTINECSFL